MISALSQQKTIAAHAEQRVKRSTIAQQQTTAPTDDSNALPPAPDGSNNQQPQQPVFLIKKEEPFWQRALVPALTVLAGLGVAAFGLHGLGNKVHTEKIQSHLAEMIKPESEYRKNFFDPRVKIYQEYDTHLKANPGISEPEKENLAKFLTNLFISESGDIADLHYIPLSDNGKAYSIPLHPETLKEAKDDFEKPDHLPQAFKDAIQETFNKLSDEFAKHEKSIVFSDKKDPSLLVRTLWKQDHQEDSIKPNLGKLSTVQTGFAVFKDFMNTMIKRGEKELGAEKIDPHKDDRKPIVINIE